MKYLKIKKGFTLAEAVVGIMFLGILLTVIAGVFVGGVSSANKSKKKVKNVILASAMLDNIMLMSYSNIPVDADEPTKPVKFDGIESTPVFINLDGTVFPPVPYPSEEVSGDGETNYYYQVEVSSFGNSNGRLKLITVTVISLGRTGAPDTKATVQSLKVL